MSNQAATELAVPAAIQTALQLEITPPTLAMMVLSVVSTSYFRLLEPSCLMVYRPGRYRFIDFLKVGLLSMVLTDLVVIFMVPQI